MELQLNDPAPDIRLFDQNGRLVDLMDHRGHWVLIYFYPKDDTPGCTTEACNLNKEFPAFKGLDLVVLGISPDSVPSHKEFVHKFKLSFSLLSDEKADVAQRYGVWGIKNVIGKEHMGINRTSFLVSPHGRIIKKYEKVNPAIHAAEVLSDMKIFST